MNRFVFVYVDSLPHARVRRGARIVPYKYAVRQPIVQEPATPSGRLAGRFRRLRPPMALTTRLRRHIVLGPPRRSTGWAHKTGDQRRRCGFGETGLSGVMVLRILVVTFAAFVVATFSGCASSTASSVRGLSPSTNPYERDIPVPTGFRLAESASEDWSGDAVRYVRHHYRGRADKYALRGFYRRQMPLVRWTLESDEMVKGRYRMRFNRGRESCTIVIEDEPGSWTRGVSVEVVIAPLSGRAIKQTRVEQNEGRASTRTTRE